MSLSNVSDSLTIVSKALSNHDEYHENYQGIMNLPIVIKLMTEIKSLKEIQTNTSDLSSEIDDLNDECEILTNHQYVLKAREMKDSIEIDRLRKDNLEFKDEVERLASNTDFLIEIGFKNQSEILNLRKEVKNLKKEIVEENITYQIIEEDESVVEADTDQEDEDTDGEEEEEEEAEVEIEAEESIECEPEIEGEVESEKEAEESIECDPDDDDEAEVKSEKEAEESIECDPDDDEAEVESEKEAEESIECDPDDDEAEVKSEKEAEESIECDPDDDEAEVESEDEEGEVEEEVEEEEEEVEVEVEPEVEVEVETEVEVEAEEAEEEEEGEEYIEVIINNVKYYTTDIINGEIFSVLEDEDIGEKMGDYINGQVKFIVEEVEDEDEDEGQEFIEVTIGNTNYYATDIVNGDIYAILEDEDIGEIVGVYKNGKVEFSKK
jgi:hypothetical protein